MLKIDWSLVAKELVSSQYYEDITIPFGTLPANVFIGGPRFQIRFEPFTPPNITSLRDLAVMVAVTMSLEDLRNALDLAGEAASAQN